MTPYTIRERRANIAAHEQAEAYPGQREKLLEGLIVHDREQAAAEAERAAEARHGGRIISRQLGDRNGDDAQRLRELQDRDDPAAVSRYWAYALSPSGGTGSGRDSTARVAQHYARDGGVEWAPGYWRAPTLPEAALDWPIYSAALNARTVTPNEIHYALGQAEARYNDVFNDKAARGRFLEGMSIAQRIYRGAMNALADGRVVDED